MAKRFARQKHKKYEEPESSKCSIFETTNMTGCCKDVICKIFKIYATSIIVSQVYIKDC